MTDQLIFVHWIDGGMRFGVEVWSTDEVDAQFLAHWKPGETTFDEYDHKVLAELREEGAVDFEEGWMRLFTDIGEGVAYIYQMAADNHADYEFDREQMIANKRRADEASKTLIDLRATLLNALGDRADEVRAAIP